jgi:hypothetical protein
VAAVLLGHGRLVRSQAQGAQQGDGRREGDDAERQITPRSLSHGTSSACFCGTCATKVSFELGCVLELLGDLKGARAEHERALAIYEATVEPKHPDAVVIRTTLQRVLQKLTG